VSQLPHTSPARSEPHLMTGDEYRQSLRDGRRVITGGEEVDDVTTHPLLRGGIDVLAELYNAQFDPDTREITTYVDADTGHRLSTGWLVPRTKDDLARRRRLGDFSTDLTLGVFGRPPDYGPTLAMGFLATMHKLEKREPEAPAKIESFIDFARKNNYMSTDLIADAQADRALPPAQNPGRLRCVEERTDGIVVYGSKPVASAATQGHWGGIATLLSPGMDPDAVMWAYLPVNAEGVTFIAREPVSNPDFSAEDHPIDSRGEEVDAFIVFDHVFIPNEHVFSFRNEDTLPLYLDVGVFPQWQILCRMARRAEIFAATAQLIVDILGTEKIAPVRAAVADVFAYAAILEACVQAAEEKSTMTPHGVCVPDRGLVTAGRLHAIVELPAVMQILRELCGQGLVSRFTAKDLERSDVGTWVDDFLPGHKITARGKNKLMNFVWDLTCGPQAARVALFENVNSTPPPAVRQQVYQGYERRAAVERLRRFLNLDGHATE
jgi:4-hydroxyphenylacetate 3-monooxygenase